MLLLLLVVTASCGKPYQATSPTAEEVRPGARYQAPPSESVFAKAWRGVTSGARRIGEAGEWTLEKARDGAVVVYRGTKKVAGRAADATQDAATTASVKTRIAAAKGVDASEIDVDTNDGVVTLRGRVDSADEAARAVRVAISTQGVDQVVSYLRWHE